MRDHRERATITVVHSDPVLDRRRQIARGVTLGSRVGYSLFGVAIVLFFIGLFTSYGTLGPIIVTAIVVGSIVLAPAIVFGYGVKAAERDDRAEGRPTMDSESGATAPDKSH